jgi:CBS domain-containing protein
MNLDAFAEDYLLRSGRRCFVAVRDSRQLGLVSIDELKQVARQRWPFTTVADIVRPFNKLPGISPDASVNEALELMVRENINQLPVISHGTLAGVIGRDHIFQYVQTQAELKAA